MAKLYIFAVCDKVIVDSSGTASLISLFNELQVGLMPQTGSLPPDAVAPKEWAVFTSWRKEPEDIGKEYIQVVQILNPDGSIFKEERIKFTFGADKTHHQNTMNTIGFPVGREGTYILKMWLEHDATTAVDPVSIDLRVKYLAGPQSKTV